MALLREAKERLELGTQEFWLLSSSLFWNTFFFADDNLKTLKLPTGTVQRGSPEVPSKEQEAGVLCGESTLSYLQSKRSFLFSEVHFRTGMNPRPFPGTASAQLRLGRNVSPRMEVTGLVDQLTH